MAPVLTPQPRRLHYNPRSEWQDLNLATFSLSASCPNQTGPHSGVAAVSIVPRLTGTEIGTSLRALLACRPRVN